MFGKGEYGNFLRFNQYIFLPTLYVRKEKIRLTLHINFGLLN